MTTRPADRPTRHDRPVRRGRRRAGMVLVYAMSGMVLMLAVATLAVDWGHVQLAKTQLSGATDAAARAGAGGLARSPADAVDAARWTGLQNVVDGTPLRIRPGDVQLGTWDHRTNTFTRLWGGDQYRANACRVLARRNEARRSAVPLSFAGVFGDPSAELSAECVAVFVPPVNVDQDVQATANPFLAGMPKGSVASLNNPHNSPDYAGTAANPRQSPAAVTTLPIVPGQALTFDSIAGTARHDPNLSDYQPDGQLNSIGHNTNGNEHGIADVTAPINALVAVFLSDDPPNETPAPVITDPRNARCPTDFSRAAERNRLTYEPRLKQIFFIGDGRTDAGAPQQFVVPEGATRLFLATWDFYEWNNNSGVRTVRVDRPQQITVVK